MKANQIEVQFNPRRKVSIMNDEEPRNYEMEAKEYLSHLSKHTQRVAIKAIQDVFALGKDWRWIATALTKKGYSTWEEWKFGLWFNKEFDKSVKAAMQREDEAQELDLDKFFSNYKSEDKYEFPDIDSINNQTIKIKAKDTELEKDSKQSTCKPLFYHTPRGNNKPHTEQYSSDLFCYYDQILEDGALELNIPVIKYGLEHNEIPEEFVAIYEEALSNYVGDVNE